MSDIQARTAVVIVLDSVGCGALPDAAVYGDEGANTLGHVAEAVGGLALPHLEALGLGNVIPIEGVTPTQTPAASYGKMAECSAGKDTTSGHWEIAGLCVTTSFPTYPDGFPPHVMERFREVTGLGWLGNKPASGTEILDELADEHMRTGNPIVYTSADSVFQIAAHEDIIGVEDLYELCRTVREMVCIGKDAVSRVIARPFVGTSGQWTRTHRRRDFALPPQGETALDVLCGHGIPTIGIGKIGEIFAWKSVTSSVHVENNMDAVDKLIEAIQEREAPEESARFIFANLVDFDMLWGHRSDPDGYASGLEAVDSRVPGIIDALEKGDLLIITADHGCDPTDASTDHSREYVPVLALVKGADTRGVDLGVRNTFADVSATVLEFFGVENTLGGKSFYSHMRKPI